MNKTTDYGNIKEKHSEKGEFVHGDNSEDTTVTEGTVFFDIRFRAVVPVTGEVISLILNVEIQNKFYPGYPVVKRGIYYGSRLISDQYGTEFIDSHYENIKKVYSIWICQNPPKYRKNTITTYTISENNVVGQVHEKKEEFDIVMTKTMEALKIPTEQRELYQKALEEAVTVGG